jgi:hypothetical protein
MNTKKEHGKIDWMITLVPLAIVVALCFVIRRSINWVSVL